MCERHRFAFNLALAYSEQAHAQFEASPMHPLATPEAPAGIGVYALYLRMTDTSPVYVGVAARHTISQRLAQHAAKIGGRQNIDLREMGCRYLIIEGEGEQWVANAAEDSLIRRHKPKWNGSGFGSKVPGEGRPGIRTSRWDTEYPPRA